MIFMYLCAKIRKLTIIAMFKHLTFNAMLRPAFLTCAVAAMLPASAQYASDTFVPCKKTDRTLYFSISAAGKRLPILWGLDTAWPDEGNIRRGVRFIGADNIGVCRVSFQPWDYLPDAAELTPRLEANLMERLRLVSFIGGPEAVRLVLNNDAPGDVVDERYFSVAQSEEATRAYCNLIYATTLSCQRKGWEVITASPLNEPDYVWNNQGSMDDFLAIAKMLKTDYPQYKDGQIRISGGNTLNCDCALPWYEFLYDYIDEGNTHQLAGDFDHYADFFARVRADGKYATADELHNVMEAMVGVEYGMQTGIWWGTAELARGEFCKASFGERLAYGENRKAWSAASVYRAPDGKIQGFVGQSERQAAPSTFRFVSTDRDVFFNGQGPRREYVVELSGGDGYQVPGQANAEYLVDITWGDDVSPVIDGSYAIANKFSGKTLAVDGALASGSRLIQKGESGDQGMTWAVKPVHNTIGGDFSYWTIVADEAPNMKLDVLNWSLEENGALIVWDGGLGGNEQWYLRYAGDGCFRIFSRHSNLCLQLAEQSDADGVAVLQVSPSDSPLQLWKFVAPDVVVDADAPAAPTGLVAQPQSASVRLDWQPSVSVDADSYVVLRAPAGTSDFSTVGRGIKDTFFIDNTVDNNMTYDYVVKTLDQSMNSSAVSAPATCAAIGEGELVAHLDFNRSLEDATVNGFNAVVGPGDAVQYGPGHIDGTYAMRFSAPRYLQIPYQAANRSTATVAFWFYLRTMTDGQHLFDFCADTDRYMALSVGSAGSVRLKATDGEKECMLEGGAVGVKEWHHVAVTMEAGRAALFLDGNLVAEDIASGITLGGIAPSLAYLGTCHEKENYLDGRLQDFQIYSTAMSDDKIPAIADGSLSAASVSSAPVLISEEYYDTMGRLVTAPTSGIYIIRRIFDNGTVATGKVRL